LREEADHDVALCVNPISGQQAGAGCWHPGTGAVMPPILFLDIDGAHRCGRAWLLPANRSHREGSGDVAAIIEAFAIAPIGLLASRRGTNPGPLASIRRGASLFGWPH
jgi:hypothetical protein